jgi:predicted DNA-binding ribbon-helix-helix protein
METSKMKSSIVKRSIIVGGHKTSVSLENEFWNALKDVARSRDSTLSDLVGSIDAGREHGNLSSAIRLFVLGTYRDEFMSITGTDAHDAVAAPSRIAHPPRG